MLLSLFYTLKKISKTIKMSGLLDLLDSPMGKQLISGVAGQTGQTDSNILKIAAPVVMGFLSKQTSQRNVNDAVGMNTVWGSMLGGQPKQNQNLINTLLDADGDGSILDDVAGMVMGTGQKKGGLLGDLFR
jgi:hypothetical protein